MRDHVFPRSLVGRFFDFNRRISRAITPDHAHEANVFGAYRKIGALLMSHPRVSTVADVGAGRWWQFPAQYKEWYRIRLIGLDIDGSAMSANALLDERIECDVVHSIPLQPGSVDLCMIHSGIEHFADNGRVLQNLFEVLRPGGFILAQFPNRYAPFAMANQLLPHSVSKWLLGRAMGDTAVALGYRAHYDRTNYSAFRNLAMQVGFRELYYMPGYYSSSYCEFFVPLFMLSYALYLIRFAIGIKNLASYNIWVLHKPANTPDEPLFQFYAWR
ncbi:MAG: methyltransferase domain-containing protein [Acetobacteraceae bacterium]|nr:methyltransferase domain-containing protein [Acetobacteraceae bacterium]